MRHMFSKRAPPIERPGARDGSPNSTGTRTRKIHMIGHEGENFSPQTLRIKSRRRLSLCTVSSSRRSQWPPRSVILLRPFSFALLPKIPPPPLFRVSEKSLSGSRICFGYPFSAPHSLCGARFLARQRRARIRASCGLLSRLLSGFDR
ncbi:hypothetical protein NL676_027381 [Syzygium grande]|nr:hypothetical protein NL676_027381 [Syzygium grande]